MDDRIERLEIHVADLLRTQDELSDVIARQSNEIATLTRRVAMLMEREAQRERDAGIAEIVGDERPPHY